MNPHAKRAAIVEEMFLAGVEAKLIAAQESRFSGTAFAWTSCSQEDRVRSLMATARLYDREMLRLMPKNRTRILTGSRPRFLWGRKRTSVAMATVLTPLGSCLQEDSDLPPIGPAELLSHVKDLVGRADVPHIVGVCSPSGFTPEVKTTRLALQNVILILIEPQDGGSWSVTAGSRNVSDADLRLFDPEGIDEKTDRIRKAIEADRASLMSAGLSAGAVGRRLGLPTKLVTRVFEHLARTDPELKISRSGEDAVLFRGAPVELEDDTMSMMDRLRQILGREGEEAKKINTLSERRARLTQRRDRIYSDLEQLEKREAELLDQGRQASSASAKRRVASQIKQLRDDMGRFNNTARMLGQQIEVISTHIHNLTLIRQGQSAKLPTSEEITEDAVRAEEMLEQLGADADLASSLNTGASETTMTDEELAILKELEEPLAEPGSAEPSADAIAPPAEPETAPEKPEPHGREPEAG